MLFNLIKILKIQFKAKKTLQTWKSRSKRSSYVGLAQLLYFKDYWLHIPLMHSRIVLLQVGDCKVHPRICSLFSTSSANVSWAKIPQERQKRKDSVLVVVHSWKPLLSGFHYHFWPILGLILQDANRAVQLVLPVQQCLEGQTAHTKGLWWIAMCLYSGTFTWK